MSDETRRKLADAIHTHAFAVTRDPRAAAQVTELVLATTDREISYYELVDSHNALLREVRGESGRPDNVLSLHVTGNRGDVA